MAGCFCNYQKIQEYVSFIPVELSAEVLSIFWKSFRSSGSFKINNSNERGLDHRRFLRGIFFYLA